VVTSGCAAGYGHPCPVTIRRRRQEESAKRQIVNEEGRGIQTKTGSLEEVLVE